MIVSKTKALTLEVINKHFNNLVPKFIFFEKKSFLTNKNFYINKIYKTFKNDIIIRSSAINEDSKKESKAGYYESYVLRRNDFHDLEKKILELIKKFKNNKDQILIQNYISKPDIAGVIFTKDKSTNSHYYDISYDFSKKSNLITSGKFNPSLKSLILYKNTQHIPSKFKKLIQIINKFEKLFANDRLDIEFCIKKQKIFVLQCRPLLGSKKKVNNKKLNDVIVNLEKKFKKINKVNETLLGNKTALSNMSDWNPAEIIGKKPSKLAFSLYSELITNSIWSKQRKNYGYKDVHPNKLMLNFAGSPYIDLRVDLNSFLPKDLNKNISKKLINHFINKIKNNPELHDKIEFELISTCYDFNISNRHLPLNKSEKKIYFSSLKKLTNNILNPKNNIIDKELVKIEMLKNKIEKISKSNLSHIQKIYYLIDDCKKYGTLSFAGIARCAFISKSILDSLKEIKLLKDKDIDNFYLSINTISKSLNHEFYLSQKKNSYKKFLIKYGHLRPSTYSISTMNYKDNYKNYFSNKILKKQIKYINNFNFNNYQISNINKIFKKNGLKINFNQFLKFAKQSIENREYSKLIFTKSIDEIFENLNKLAKEINIDPKIIEHLDIDIIIKSFHDLEQEKLKKIILRNIKINQKSYNFSQNILLPDVIYDNKNFSSYYNFDCKENYITKKTKIGEIIELKKLNNFKKINKKIVLIENADPGFDFLFSYNIDGLITKYGGSNSHMAIRCMELGLPAIIGVGDKTYENFSNSKKVFIDCNNKNYSIIH